MNRLLLLTVLFGTASVWSNQSLAQTNYHIEIKNDSIIKVAQKSPLYLYIGEDNAPSDSTSIINGELILRGKTKDITPASIAFKNTKSPIVSIIIDGEPITIEGNDKLKITTSSEENKRYAKVQQKIDYKMRELNTLREKIAVLGKNGTVHIPDSLMSSLQQEWQNILDELSIIVKNELDENKENYIPICIIPKYAEILDNNYLYAYLNNYKYKEHPLLKRIIQIAEGNKRKTIGAHFTDFLTKNTEGKDVKLSDYAGKGHYLLVDFWASWCGPCRAELPYLKELYNEYHPKGFEILGISLDNKESAWKNAIERINLPWKHASDLQGWKSKAAEIYSIDGIPFTILIDPNGNIIATGLRHGELKEKLQSIYNK